MVSTYSPTNTQYNLILIQSAHLTLTLEELPHSPGFVSTKKRYISWYFFRINFHFCTLYSINVKPSYYQHSYIFEEMDFTGENSRGEINFNDEGVCWLL